jgi:hypothetical protein
VGGIADAKKMVEHTAKVMETKPHEWLVCSTGRIGSRLPMAKLKKGIQKAAGKLDSKGGAEAAKAIMTTDTRRKEYAMRFKMDGRKVTIRDDSSQHGDDVVRDHDRRERRPGDVTGLRVGRGGTIFQPDFGRWGYVDK